MAIPSKASEFLKSVRSKANELVVNGHTVRLRPLSVRELLELRVWHAEHESDPTANITFAQKMVAASVVDEDGSTVLNEDDAAGLDMVALSQIAEAIEKLNGGSTPGKPVPETPN